MATFLVISFELPKVDHKIVRLVEPAICLGTVCKRSCEFCE